MSYFIDSDKVIYADLSTTEGILVNLETKYYYCLNETAQIVWQELSKGSSIELMAEYLSQNFETDVSRVKQDIETILHEMMQEKLIEKKRE